jgi:hypothetical protein
MKFNETLCQNKTLRTKIDEYRRERVVFDVIYKKLERELHEKKKEMADEIERQKKARVDSLCECWICCGKDTHKRACRCFFKTSPRLAGQAQPPIFSQRSPREAQQGHPLSG